MSMPGSVLPAAVALALSTMSALAPAQELRSGPPKGTRLGELRIAHIAGAAAGSESDLAAACARGPAAFLFVHELTRNVAPLLRGFDATCADLAVLGLHGGAVLLAGDRTAAEQRAPVVSRALQMQSPLVLSVDGAEGPGGYALNRKAELTLVLARDGVVVDSLAFVDTGRQDLDLLELALTSLCGPVPEDGELEAVLARTLPQDRGELVRIVAALERQRRLLAEQRDAARGPAMTDAAPARPGAMRAAAAAAGAEPPVPAGGGPLARVTDAELAAILRRIVRQDADAAALDAAFAALDARAADPALREQAARAITAVLDGDAYGNDLARSRLRAWLTRRDDR
jgi:hypothetical protein